MTHVCTNKKLTLKIIIILILPQISLWSATQKGMRGQIFKIEFFTIFTVFQKKLMKQQSYQDSFPAS